MRHVFGQSFILPYDELENAGDIAFLDGRVYDSLIRVSLDGRRAGMKEGVAISQLIGLGGQTILTRFLTQVSSVNSNKPSKCMICYVFGQLCILPYDELENAGDIASLDGRVDDSLICVSFSNGKGVGMKEGVAISHLIGLGRGNDIGSVFDTRLI